MIETPITHRKKSARDARERTQGTFQGASHAEPRIADIAASRKWFAGGGESRNSRRDFPN